MKVTRYQCDKCGKASNGDGLQGWWAVITEIAPDNEERVCIERLADDSSLTQWLHCCGMECAVSVVSEQMAALREAWK